MMKRTHDKAAKVTPRSIINMKKAIESRSAGRHRTPGDENVKPCSSSGTPLSTRVFSKKKEVDRVTPLFTSSKINRQGKTTPTTPCSRGTPTKVEKTVLFEFNDDLLLNSGNKNAGVTVTQTSSLQVDRTPCGPHSSVLNRSRSASCITRYNKTAKLRRSMSEARIAPDQDSSKGANDGETSRISVGVRIRPLHPREYGNALSVDGCEVKLASDLGSEMTFSYDHTFTSSGPKAASQEEVYTAMVKPLLDNVFEGYNACLFAYGQTGSGKTYSMMGPDTQVDDITEQTGVIPRFCRELIERCSSSNEDVDSEGVHVSTSVEISYLEVYNEKIRDLLIPTGNAPLRVREHPVHGPYVADLSKHTANTFNDIKHWITEGNKKRIVAATDMNETSSRSHSLFMVTLTQSTVQNKGGGTWSHEHTRRSQINLVDLAGSERIAHSSVSSDRLREGVSINKSLLTLGKVISALIENRSFVPYRESVLTWLLKESLGGNSRTSMLATVSPCNTHLDETMATLRYASQARTIVNTVRINESPQDKMIRELQAEVEQLKEINSTLEHKTVTPSRKMFKAGESNEEITKMKDEMKKLEGVVKDLKGKLNESHKKVVENQNRADAAEKKVESLQWESQERSVLEKEVEELKRKLTTAEAERSEWSSKLTSLERHWSAKVQSLEKEVISWKERLVAKEKREEEWQRKLVEAESLPRMLDISSEEKERWVQRIESLEEETLAWKRKAEELTSEIKVLTVKSEEDSNQLAVLEMTTESLKKDKEELEKCLKESEDALEKTHSDYELMVSQWKDKYAKLENQIISERQERDLLERSVHVLTNQLDSCSTKTHFHLTTAVQVQTGPEMENDDNNEAEELKSECEKIKKEMVKLKKKLVGKIGKLEILKDKASKVDLMEEKLKDITVTKNNLESELNKTKEVLKESENSMNVYKENCMLYENEIKILKKDCESLDAEMKLLRATSIESGEVDKFKFDNLDLKKTVEQLSKKLIEKEELISSLENRMVSFENLKQQLVLVKDEKTALNENLKNSIDKLENCEKSIGSLSNENRQLSSEVKELKKLLKDVSSEKNILKEINEQMELDMNGKKYLVDNESIYILEKKISELEEELNTKEEALRSLSEESSYKLELEMSKSHILQSELEEIKDLLKKKESEVDHFKTECENMSSELEILKELEEKYQDRVESSFKERENLESKINAEREIWETSKKELEDKIKQTEIERDTLKVKLVESPTNLISGSDPDLVQITSRSDLFERKASELQIKLDQKTNLISELEKLNSRLKEDLALSQVQNNDLFKSVSELTKQVGEVVERAAMVNTFNCETNLTEDACKTPKLDSDPNVLKEQLQDIRRKYKSLNSKYGDTLLKNKELEDMLKEKDKRLVDLHGQMILVEKMLQDEITNKLLPLKKQDENNLKNNLEEDESNGPETSIKEQLARKKKRIEKMKSRIDKLEDLLISTMRTANEKKSQNILRQEYAKVYECMMEHSYLFHWEYLLKKARTYAHKYHIPYEFESHDNATVPVKHLTLNAKSYWFRVDLIAWFERIEKEDKWDKIMDKDIQWEIDLSGYYDNNKTNKCGSKCPVEQEYYNDVILCCKPDYICPELWKRTIVQRHMNGLKEDAHSLLLFFNKTNNQNILDFLRCIENLISQLELEFHEQSS